MNLPGFTAERAVQLRASGFRRRFFHERGSQAGEIRPAMDPFSPESIAAFNEETEAMAWQDYWLEEEAFEKFAWEEAEKAAVADMGELAVAGGELIVAVGIGIILGGTIGLGLEQAFTGTAPGPTATTAGCVTNPVAPRVRTVNDTSWGCERGVVNAQLTAASVCASVPGQCSGQCPGGKPCTASATMVPGTLNQSTGWLGFWCNTSYSYECECGC
jgi:hypothetical protein